MIKYTKKLFDIKECGLPFFARESYLKTISDEYGWLYSDNFLLPFVVRKKYFFRYITFTNDTVYLNRLEARSWKLEAGYKNLELEPGTQNTKHNKEVEFLNEAIDFLKQEKYDFITQPPTNVLFKAYPDNSNYCKFGTYIVDLKQDEDIIFSNIHSKHKNVIRKAIRDGIIIERGNHLADKCYQIINNTLTKNGLSFVRKEEYEKMIKNSKDGIEFFLSKSSERCEGAAIIPYDRKSAYYLYGGSVENHHLGSINLLHWEVIKFFKQKGLESYNLVGARIEPEKDSKVYGIQEFKKRFGGLLDEGYLWKYNLNAFKTKLYGTLLYLKTRSKSIDIIDKEGIKK